MIYSPRKSGWAQSSLKKIVLNLLLKVATFLKDRSLDKPHHSSVVFRSGWSRTSAPLSSRPKFQYVEPYCRPNFGGFPGKSPHNLYHGEDFLKKMSSCSGGLLHCTPEGDHPFRGVIIGPAHQLLLRQRVGVRRLLLLLQRPYGEDDAHAARGATEKP